MCESPGSLQPLPRRDRLTLMTIPGPPTPRWIRTLGCLNGIVCARPNRRAGEFFRPLRKVSIILYFWGIVAFLPAQ
jgi:hypothetical protein